MYKVVLETMMDGSKSRGEIWYSLFLEKQTSRQGSVPRWTKEWRLTPSSSKISRKFQWINFRILFRQCVSLPKQLFFPGIQTQRNHQWDNFIPSYSKATARPLYKLPWKYQSREKRDDHLRAIVLMSHMEKQILNREEKSREDKKSLVATIV